MFSKDDIGVTDFCVKVDTEEKANTVRYALKDLGYNLRWRGGEEISESHWDMYRNNTVYYISDELVLTYGDDYYAGDTAMEFDEFYAAIKGEEDMILDESVSVIDLLWLQ